MAHGNNVSVYFTFEDAVGRQTTMFQNHPENADIAALKGTLVTEVTRYDSLSGCKVVNAGISIGVNYTAVTLKDSPLLGSDVEAGAMFSFESTAGAPIQYRIPAIDETLAGLDATSTVDTSVAAVDAFVQRIIAGDTQGATTVRWSDAAGNNVDRLVRARDSFRPRKRN